MLTAVCRGKLCEGVDFTDRQCRLVIVIGIPYPAKNDLRVLLKQNFMDTLGAEGDGRRWYSREAIRAVNQTLGRVIRHRHDFGAVLLCDGRYARNGQLSSLASGLSSWLKPRVSVQDSFDNALESCRAFFGVLRPVAPPRPTPPEKEDCVASATAPPPDGATVAEQRSDTLGIRGGRGGIPAGGASAGGVPLSALGALWKRRGRLKAAPVAAGAPRAAAVVPPSGASPPPGTVCGKAPPGATGAPMKGPHPEKATSNGNARLPAGITPPRFGASSGGAGGVGKRDSSQAWLEKAEGLLPRMEYERARVELAVMGSQAALVCEGGFEAADADRRLTEAMQKMAEILLPEFCFDTETEERLREVLVRECGTLLPKLLWPLWRERVEMLLREQGRQVAGLWSA